MRLQSLARRVRATVRPPRPADVAPGWVLAPPDFIGVGAQRSGTTWWYELLTTHPQVHATTKELHYFHRLWDRPWPEDGSAAYARWFARPAGQLCGEWSPGYMAHFWIPPLMRQAAPDAKFLVIVRDPVERYRSGLVLQAETRRPNAASASSAFRLGCYGQQLAHLFTSIPRAQVLVLQFERCVETPTQELSRTYRFLGLDDQFVPDDLHRARNRLPGRKPVLDEHTARALIDAYATDRQLLAELVPELDFDLWTSGGTSGSRGQS